MLQAPWRSGFHSGARMFPLHLLDPSTNTDIRGLLEKYPTFGREKETGLPGALDT